MPSLLGNPDVVLRQSSGIQRDSLMPSSYESVFSYNVTRPYPFKWFTWVVAIGGIVATVLFSILNFASNAFTLSSLYTSDPNSTVAESHWYDRSPFSLVQKFNASCQAQDIPVNSELFSTNLGLTYRLVNISRPSTDNDITVLPSLTYFNNTLLRCFVPRVLIDATNTNSIGNGPYWIWETSTISAVAVCDVSNDQVPTEIVLSVQWRPKSFVASTGGSDPSYFVRLDRQNSANLWWAQEILWGAYYQMGGVFTAYKANEKVSFENTLKRVKLDLVTMPDRNISNTDFFNIECTTFTATGGTSVNGSATDGTSANQTFPCQLPVGRKVDDLAKVFYSAILADLGSVGSRNVLADEELLQDAISELGSNEKLFSGTSSGEVWATFGPTTGSLAVKPATLYTQYLCQVPVTKNVGSLIVAIFIADLVLLRALWSVFVFCTSLGLKRADKMAHHCEGCCRTQQTLRPDEFAESKVTSRSMGSTKTIFSTFKKPVTSAYELVPAVWGMRTRYDSDVRDA